MQITSILPFFLMMTSFVVTGYFLCRILPSYSSLVPQLLSKKGYYLELESMRGLLALSVVVHHAVIWYVLLYRNTNVITGPHATFYSQLGTAPVTFFFFITGFLFWSKLIANPKPAPGAFMTARLRRLAPAYLAGAALLFTLVAIFTHFRLHSSPFELAHDSLKVILGQNPKLNGLNFAPWLWGVTWTLQFEFLFYMCIPFLGWFAQTLWKSLLFIGGCNLIYALSLVIDPVRWHLHGFYLFQTLLRFFCFTFCIGFVTAHLVKVSRIRQLARSVWVAPVAIATIVLTMCFLPAHYGLVESLCLALPFIAMACGCDFWGLLRTPPLLFLGQISYSVYLIHCLLYGAILIPLFSFMGNTLRSGAVFWAVALLMSPFIVGMATLWNHTFELPFLGKRSAPRRVLPSIGASPLPPSKLA